MVLRRVVLGGNLRRLFGLSSSSLLPRVFARLRAFPPLQVPHTHFNSHLPASTESFRASPPSINRSPRLAPPSSRSKLPATTTTITTTTTTTSEQLHDPPPLAQHPALPHSSPATLQRPTLHVIHRWIDAAARRSSRQQRRHQQRCSLGRRRKKPEPGRALVAACWRRDGLHHQREWPQDW